MAIKKKGLGKGLDSMFPSYTNQTPRTNAGQKSAPSAEQKQKTVKKAKNPSIISVKGETADTVEDQNDVFVTDEGIDAADSVNTEVNDALNHTNVDSKNTQESLSEEKSVITLKISEVEPNRKQPRKEFNEDALLELSESVRQYGIIQPLIVQKREDYYEIIAGERRWRAAKMAGLKEVPVVIKDYTDQEIMEVSLIENIQREDLNPIEEAKAYQKLLEEYGMKQDELAEKVAKNRTTITNALRLLKLDPRVRQMLIDEMLTTGHARTLLGIQDYDQQYDAAQLVFEQKMSVRETEKLVKKLTNPAPVKETPKQQGNEAMDLICREIEDRMKDILGTKVSVKRKNDQKGRVEIEYYSSEELERIYEMIRSIRG